MVRGCGFQEVPSSVIRLSIPVRQALAKLTLPVLIAAAFGLMLLGKADALLAERARMALADALAPIFGILAEPLASARAAVDNGRHLLTIYEDNPWRWRSMPRTPR